MQEDGINDNAIFCIRVVHASTTLTYNKKVIRSEDEMQEPRCIHPFRGICITFLSTVECPGSAQKLLNMWSTFSATFNNVRPDIWQ